MQDNDKKRFAVAMGNLGTAFKTQVSHQQLRLFFTLFSDYSIDEFEKACFDFMLKGRFFPAPADLIDLIPASKAAQHVSAEEAWAIALEAMDECSTVVVTNEILEAKTICQDVYDSGDRVGARMSFKDTYNRIIKTASKPVWRVSEGYDKARREDAVRKAVALGRLSQSDASRYLTYQEPDKKSKEIAQGIFEKMKMSLQFQTDEEKIADRERRRQDFENYRKAELQKLSEKLKG